MGNNSIKNNLGKDDIISDIVLSMGADIKRKNVYLIVEGEGDKKFLRKFLSNNVNIYESFSGKQGVKEIVEYFKHDIKVIGIRDRDYHHDYISEKLFYYDYNCL